MNLFYSSFPFIYWPLLAGYLYARVRHTDSTADWIEHSRYGFRIVMSGAILGFVLSCIHFVMASNGYKNPVDIQWENGKPRAHAAGRGGSYFSVEYPAAHRYSGKPITYREYISEAEYEELRAERKNK